MPKLDYNPIAIQNEGFGGTIENPEIIVIIKTEAQGKSKKYYKTLVKQFPNWHYLDKYIKDNKLPIISEEDFNTTNVDKVLHLVTAEKAKKQ